MPVSAADVAELRRLADEVRDDGSLAPLDSTAEVLAYCVAVARAEDHDECDVVEALCRAVKMSRDELRRDEALLRRLGYRAVADRLRKLSRRKRCC
jgi:hypothetical protein